MFGSNLMLMFISQAGAAGGFPRASKLTKIGPGAAGTTITDTAYGVSITPTDSVAVMLDTSFSNGRVFAQYYLTGRNTSATWQAGPGARLANPSSTNVSGYMMQAVRMTGAGEYYGQPRQFTGSGMGSNTLTGNSTLPGTLTDYNTEMVNAEGEVFGDTFQVRTWLASEPKPAWQNSGSLIFVTGGGSTINWTSGKFGFAIHQTASATVHLTHLSAVPITALSA